MSRSAAFRDYLDGAGVWWPEGDGDAMRLAATAWTEIATFLDDAGAVLDTVAARLAENYRGEAARRFAETWDRYTGADGYVARTGGDCRQLAATLRDFGGDIDRTDATLLQLIDEALEMRRVAASVGADPAVYDDWLRDCGAVVGGQLGNEATQRCAALAHIAACPEAGEPIDVASIDPADIAWADVGDPEDYSYLATEEVDFGAGPGTLGGPSVEVPVVPEPEFPEPDASESDGTTPESELPEPELPEFDFDDPTTEDTGGDDPYAAGGGGAGGGGAGFGGGGGFSVPQPEPIEIPEPDPVDTAALLGGAGAATAAGAAAAKSSRMPFFPMMGGMGGAGGEEGEEPKRRRRRTLLG